MLFGKQEKEKFIEIITDIYAYLVILENNWAFFQRKSFCLDICRIRKWILINIIYYINKEQFNIANKYLDLNIIGHIDKHRYTNYYNDFVENYKKGIVKLDDIIKL